MREIEGGLQWIKRVMHKHFVRGKEREDYTDISANINKKITTSPQLLSEWARDQFAYARIEVGSLMQT